MMLLRYSRISFFGMPVLACLTGFASKASAFDAVTCGTEQTAFRQLCKVDGVDHSQAFSIEGQSEYRGYHFDVGSVLKNPKLAFEGADNSVLNLDLLGLQPILEFDTNFTNLDACRQSTLWKDRIAVYLKLPSGGEALASDVIVGAKHHTIDLTANGQDATKYLISSEGEQVALEAKFFFKNLDDFPGRSVSLKRIPPGCKLDVFNQQITFDPVDVNTSLQSLKIYTATLDQTILKSIVLNGMYLKMNSGALCSIEKLSNTLYSVEALPLTEDPDQLSLPSQQAIADAVSYAVSIGALSQNEIPKDPTTGAPLYFDYYKNKATRDALIVGCKSILDDLTVSRKKFLAADGVTPTNEAAYKNALDYERSIRNLRKILDAAWALVSVAKKDVENNKDLDWMLDPKLYGFVSITPAPNN